MTKKQVAKDKIGIVDRDAPILRRTAKPVPISDIGSKKIQNLIAKMSKALRNEEDGVAIAAPQVGSPLRIFLVSSKIFEDKGLERDMVFINPEIIKLSREKTEMEEGCLSVRWYYGWVKRSVKAVVRAYDEKGGKFQMGASGLLAQIFQHEMDHFDGILFTDKARGLKNLPPQKDAK